MICVKNDDHEPIVARIAGKIFAGKDVRPRRKANDCRIQMLKNHLALQNAFIHKPACSRIVEPTTHVKFIEKYFQNNLEDYFPKNFTCRKEYIGEHTEIGAACSSIDGCLKARIYRARNKHARCFDMFDVF